MPKTFVLVHGAWHGGWCWRRVADRLRASGFEAFTPTLTGLGERSHLLSATIDLETMIQDVVRVVEAEELRDVVLVGHSFGGIPITGVADRMPDRLRHLVYLDAVVLDDGECGFDVLPPAVVVDRVRAAEATSGGLTLPVPDPSAFGVTDTLDAAWLQRRMTPHPLRGYTSPLRLKGPPGNGLPRTYVVCTNPVYPALEGVRDRIRSREGWAWREIATGHDAMVTAPNELADLLQEIG